VNSGGGLHPHRAVCLQMRALEPGDLLRCMSPVMADIVAKVFLHW
jgi:hypothetical protein